MTDLEAIILPLKKWFEPTVIFSVIGSRVVASIPDSPSNIQLVTIETIGTAIRVSTGFGKVESWDLCNPESFDPTEFFQAVSSMILERFISSTHMRLCQLERYVTMQRKLAQDTSNIPARY